MSCTQFSFDEARVPGASFQAGPSQEGLEVLLDDRVQHRLFRLVALVLVVGKRGGGRSRMLLVVDRGQVVGARPGGS
jgi:hypothetical protein